MNTEGECLLSLAEHTDNLTMPRPDMTTFEAPMPDFPVEELDFSSLDNLAGNLTFTAANIPTSNTISPQDLFLDADFAIPGTTTTGYLSTPSLVDCTPDLSSYDCSPAFGNLDNETSWPPLFTDTGKDDLDLDVDFSGVPLFPATSIDTAPLAPTVSNTSSTVSKRPRSSLNVHSTPSDDILRRTLGPSSVIKSSRRQIRDLDPIAVDEDDDRAVKRARNTMAARKSRQKKRDIEDSLREALEEMTRQRDRWRMLAVKHGAPIDLE